MKLRSKVFASAASAVFATALTPMIVYAADNPSGGQGSSNDQLTKYELSNSYQTFSKKGQTIVTVHLGENTFNGKAITVTVNGTDSFTGKGNGQHISFDMGSEDNILKPGDVIVVTTKDTEGNETPKKYTIASKEGNESQEQDKGKNNYNAVPSGSTAEDGGTGGETGGGTEEGDGAGDNGGGQGANGDGGSTEEGGSTGGETGDGGSTEEGGSTGGETGDGGSTEIPGEQPQQPGEPTTPPDPEQPGEPEQPEQPAIDDGDEGDIDNPDDDADVVDEADDPAANANDENVASGSDGKDVSPKTGDTSVPVGPLAVLAGLLGVIATRFRKIFA